MEMGTLQWIDEELKWWEWEPCSCKEKFQISDAVEKYNWMVADCMEKKKQLWCMKWILVQLKKTLNNYDVGQRFLMKYRALQGGTNFNPLGYHGRNQAV